MQAEGSSVSSLLERLSTDARKRSEVVSEVVRMAKDEKYDDVRTYLKSAVEKLSPANCQLLVESLPVNVQIAMLEHVFVSDNGETKNMSDSVIEINHEIRLMRSALTVTPVIPGQDMIVRYLDANRAGDVIGMMLTKEKWDRLYSDKPHHDIGEIIRKSLKADFADFPATFNDAVELVSEIQSNQLTHELCSFTSACLQRWGDDASITKEVEEIHEICLEMQTYLSEPFDAKTLENEDKITSHLKTLKEAEGLSNQEVSQAINTFSQSVKLLVTPGDHNKIRICVQQLLTINAFPLPGDVTALRFHAVEGVNRIREMLFEEGGRERLPQFRKAKNVYNLILTQHKKLLAKEEERQVVPGGSQTPPQQRESRPRTFTERAVEAGWLTEQQLQGLNTKYDNNWILVASEHNVPSSFKNIKANKVVCTDIAPPGTSHTQIRSFLIPVEGGNDGKQRLAFIRAADIPADKKNEVLRKVFGGGRKDVLPTFTPSWEFQRNKLREWQQTPKPSSESVSSTREIKKNSKTLRKS